MDEKSSGPELLNESFLEKKITSALRDYVKLYTGLEQSSSVDHPV